MKKIFLAFIVFFTVNAHLIADGLTATLQQGDKMTPFYGKNAFIEAYKAAEDGAVITLSAGWFDIDSENNVIAKEITIIGNYGFDYNKVGEITMLQGSHMRITANNVKIEGIFLPHGLILGTATDSITNCTLKHCSIKNTFSADNKHRNTLIDQCAIMGSDYAIKSAVNYCIRNSTINYLATYGSAETVYITNCVIWNWGITNSMGNTITVPQAIYKNNILVIKENKSPYMNLNIDNPHSIFYNNVFCGKIINSIKIGFSYGSINENNIQCEQEFNEYDEYPAYPINPPLGQDGTVVGPFGGTGFSEYPNIPRITSKEIDSNTDEDGKLKVKLTVKAY